VQRPCDFAASRRTRAHREGVLLDFGHFSRNQRAGTWQPNKGFIEGVRRLGNFVMSASPPDFT
jgi:hypothetical protein